MIEGGGGGEEERRKRQKGSSAPEVDVAGPAAAELKVKSGDCGSTSSAMSRAGGR